MGKASSLGKEGIAALGAIILVVVATALSGLLFGWLLMLSIGILAGAGVVGGTIGLFWDGFWLGVIFSSAFGALLASART